MSNVVEVINSQSGPQLLGALDLARAPEQPGIYAWYAQIPLGPQDWQQHIVDGEDKSGSYLKQAIAAFARFHTPNPISLTGDGSYGLPWSGSLQRASISDADASSTGGLLNVKLDTLADDPEARKLLISLLNHTAPIFASPLYIGVATNLRVRLAEHIRGYEDARESVRRNPAEAERLQFEGTSFGHRLAGTGLQLDYLRCWVLPVELTFQSEVKSAREVAAVVEWVLQRTFLPVLGRQ